MGLAVELGPGNGITGGRFAFQVRALKSNGFKIIREQCFVCKKNGERYFYDRKHDGDTTWHGNIGLTPAIDSSALLLPLVGGDGRFAPLFKTLGAMRVYSIEPSTLREMQDFDTGLALKSDGSNTARILHELLRGDDAAFNRETINGILETIVPATTSVVPLQHGKKISMNFTQEWGGGKKLSFDAGSMSDGTLRSLGIIMAVMQKPSPSVLVIEEPEATIHSGALDAIIDLLRWAAQSMQVVVTTHSPELLDNKWIKGNNLRIITWREGASDLSIPSEMARKAIKQKLMGAGELLRSNALYAEEIPSGKMKTQPAKLFENIA